MIESFLSDSFSLLMILINLKMRKNTCKSQSNLLYLYDDGREEVTLHFGSIFICHLNYLEVLHERLLI